MIFATLLAAASTVAGPETSPLVEESHTHDWLAIIDIAEGGQWVDQNLRETHEQDGETYPVVLMRTYTTDYMGDFTADARLAVDCDGNRLGIVEAWMKSSDEGEGRRATETVTFDFAENPPTDNENRVIEFACNAETTGS